MVIRSGYWTGIAIASAIIAAAVALGLASGIWDPVPIWAAAVILTGALAITIRLSKVRVEMTDDKIRIVNFLRSSVIKRTDIQGIESSFDWLAGERALVLVTPSRRVRLTASISATPMAREVLRGRLGDHTTPPEDQIDLLAAQRSYDSIAMHPWRWTAGIAGLSLLAALLAGLSWLEVTAMVLATGLVVRATLTVLSRLTGTRHRRNETST